MRRAAGPASPGPPQPSPRRRNAVLGLYDAPLHRDWAFWLTSGLAVLTAVSIGTSPEQASGLPRWLDTLLAVITFALLFGALPAWIRLVTRRRQWRNQRTAPPPPRTTPPPHRAPPPRTAPQPRAAPPPPRRTPPQTPAPGQDPLATARRTLPHPVARTVHEMQRAYTHKDRYEALLEAGETLAATVAVTAAGLLQAHGIGARNLSALRSALASGGGITFGVWTDWLHNLCPLVRDRTDVVPGLAEALRDAADMAARPDDPGLVQFLDRLRDERNRTAHNDKPRTQEEAALRVAGLQPSFERALWHAQFLGGLPWLLTVSCAYQRGTGSFVVVAQHLMGDHPDFDRLTFPCQEPVADDTVYVLSPAGPVALSPFAASRYCAECGQREVCYAARAGHRTRPAAYKSFGRGHSIPCPELDEEIAALPGRRPPPRTPR
ncbi:hypothetical protein ACH4OW_08060 [Streptomyces sp. NPDC017056]|uniref:hypothetical protein n=1 Tax=Streptomyces sp. NPDC017056 TaxID=3364973 RepID=UPI0037A35426